MTQTLTVELTGSNSLQALLDLEQKDLIRILKEPEVRSYSLPGEPLSDEDFRKWVEYAETTPVISLAETKKRWAVQKLKLQKLIR